MRELIYECHTWYRTPSVRIPPSFFDWTQITHLGLRGRQMCEYSKALKGLPTALRTLKVENFCYAMPNNEEPTKALARFMSEISGLVHLTLVNFTGRLPAVVFSLQGAALKTLSYHRPRLPWSHTFDGYRPPHHALSVEELDEISGSCPNLAALTIDMGITHDLVWLSSRCSWK